MLQDCLYQLAAKSVYVYKVISLVYICKQQNKILAIPVFLLPWDDMSCGLPLKYLYHS